ncbi:hypothetical protein FRC08_000068 [Ceratobasidium sp. 394]|nr:hypothetical protein FRC08_000068 [Ceratobasidium sp. 394]
MHPELEPELQRVKKLLYNEAAKRDPEDKPARTSTLNTFISVRTLFLQRYQDHILAHRANLTSSTDPQELLRAYNKAVDLELKQMAIDCPEDLEELERLVREAKESGKRGFHELPADVQDVLLDALPGDIAATLKTWERKTNARIYIMASWAASDGVPVAFE